MRGWQATGGVEGFALLVACLMSLLPLGRSAAGGRVSSRCTCWPGCIRLPRVRHLFAAGRGIHCAATCWRAHTNSPCGFLCAQPTRRGRCSAGTQAICGCSRPPSTVPPTLQPTTAGSRRPRTLMLLIMPRWGAGAQDVHGPREGGLVFKVDWRSCPPYAHAEAKHLLALLTTIRTNSYLRAHAY